MGFTGSAPNKTYVRTDGTRTGSAVNVTAQANGVNNTSALADNRENDIASALTTSWQVNGDNQPVANLPMNDKKFTGLAAGSAANDSIRLAQIQAGGLIYAEATGTANAIELTTTPTFTPIEGTMILFIAEADNSGATTVNVNGTSALALQYGGAACSGGEVNNGQAHVIVNDGTQWQLANPARLFDLTALAKTDGNIIVGDGTSWVAESGATARTSLGLGTADSPTFANPVVTTVEVGHASDTTLSRSSAGNLAVEGNLIYRAGGTDVPVADGGSGRSDSTAYAVICGGTTSTAAHQSIASVGTAGQVLTSNGAGALPTMQEKATLATEQATTSGTAFDFTSIGSAAKRISVILNEVSLDGTDELLVQLGDSGGIETSGYISTADVGNVRSSSSAGFLVVVSDASRVVSGIMTIIRVNSLTWVASFAGKLSTTAACYGGGSKTLSATLDRVRITRSGTNNFDNGSVSILWE